MDSLIRTRMSAFFGSALLVMSQAGNAVTVAESPLFITEGVTPNVMLVVDNSGSMESIIWASGYDPTVTYPDWSPIRLVGGTCAGGTNFAEGWTSLTGSVTYSTLITSRYRGTCDGVAVTPVTCPTANTTRGVSADGLTTKCVTLPSPAGGATRYTGNYLNYLFETYANGTDLTTGLIPNDYRMNVAKNVAANVVSGNTNLRMGLTAFNTDDGGRVLNSCDVGNTADLLTSISGLSPTTWTPLGEALYEVTRYFRGMDGFYNDVDYESPIEYRCQKNFVIVITDGYPTQDTEFPDDDPADPDGLLPNWDGLAPATTAAQYPNFSAGSDGFQPSGSNTDEGYTLYLDDIAKFAYDIDLRTGGNDVTNVSFDDPSYAKQNLVTYTVGFAVANQMMADAAENGTGTYYQAGNEEELTEALQQALSDIEARTSSASSVATNTTRLAADTFIFQARFSTSDWGGELLAFPIGSDGEIGELNGDGVPVLGARTGWDAADEIPAAGDRNILTYDPATNSGLKFVWGELTSEQQDALNRDNAGVDDGLGEKRLAYLRGDQSGESPAATDFRVRSSLLGDIINSDPFYAGVENYGFDDLPGSEGTSYKTYRKSAAYKNRTPVVYVAANDGMLHGFEVETGEELFAYVPNATFSELSYLTDEDFNGSHRLINDGSPWVVDAYLGGAWKSTLVGSLGGGGKGIYALDVSDPEDFDESDVLWEFTSDDDSNMGVAIPQPRIGRMYDGSWVAIIANGYNSGGNATLFILDLETGAKLKEFDTGVGGDNGLSTPLPVDVDNDRIVDYIYAGDLRGNMWKFDVTSGDPADWEIAFSGSPLYTACSADPCTTTNRQPITAQPEVGISPPAGYFVYFGTGRYFAVGDNGVGTGANTIYAIRDTNTKDTASAVLPGSGRSTLVEQEVLNEQTIDFGDYSESVRVTSNNPIVDSDDGWFLDLPSSGERQVSTPILRGGRLIVTTIVPSGDSCSAGGDSWLMEFNSLSGSRLTAAPIDLNRDRSFDVEDFVRVDPNDPDSALVAVTGVKSRTGITKTPGLVATDESDLLYEGGSKDADPDDPDCETSACKRRRNAGNLRGRQSWREIQ